ncbi:MAG: zinc ribbon domain-containing protein [bacterium]|nr:zinc ribbon domain-containing protein [bacterium]
MPVYEYQAKAPEHTCEHCAGPFEFRHGMHDPPLSACPACGVPVVRVVSTCRVDTRPGTKNQLGDKNLKRLGFSKLVNEGDGKFRKTV